MEKLTGAQILVKCLEQYGVEYIFGIPGAKIDAVFNALLDSSIQVVLCRHEQNAAFMAAAYGRQTGKPGVVLVTSGPGVSNLVTGLLTATTEGDPIVALGGNVPRNMRLKQSHQSSDNVKLLAGATKYCVEVSMVDNIPEILANAFRAAIQPRSGASFISFPQDVLLETTQQNVFLPAPLQSNGAPETLLRTTATALAQAQLPLLLLGQEASRPENTKAIRALLHHHAFAVIGTYQAAGVIPRDLLHCFFGRVGLFKNQPGDQMLDQADLILTIGYNPTEYDPEIWNHNNSKHIIHLDYNPAEIRLGYTPRCELIGDIAASLNQLTTLLPAQSRLNDNTALEELQQRVLQPVEETPQELADKVHPLCFIRELRRILDDDTTVISDIGTHYMWLARYLFAHRPHQLLFSNGQQTLGVALPWAIATNLARPGKKVISISGDGGFLFSAMELETAVRLRTPFVHFVWCDGTYNMVLEQEVLKYKRESAVHFGYVDIVQYAHSFGARGVRLTQSSQIEGILEEAWNYQVPTLVEVAIDYRDNPALFQTVSPHVGN